MTRQNRLVFGALGAWFIMLVLYTVIEGAETATGILVFGGVTLALVIVTFGRGIFESAQTRSSADLIQKRFADRVRNYGFGGKPARAQGGNIRPNIAPSDATRNGRRIAVALCLVAIGVAATGIIESREVAASIFVLIVGLCGLVAALLVR